MFASCLMLSEKSPISTGYNHHKQVSECSHHKVWAFLVCMVIGVWRYLLIHTQGLAHTFFLWYGYRKAAWIRSISYFKKMAYLELKTKREKLLFHLNIWKCSHLVVDCHWLEIINISMLTLILTTSK